jgi:hypothetical protein
MPNAIHLPTGLHCVVMYANADGSMFMCNFGERSNPFTWVNADELADAPEVAYAAIDAMQGGRAQRHVQDLLLRGAL